MGGGTLFQSKKLARSSGELKSMSLEGFPALGNERGFVCAHRVAKKIIEIWEVECSLAIR